MELKITATRLPGREGLWDVVISNSHISEIARTIPVTATQTLWE